MLTLAGSAGARSDSTHGPLAPQNHEGVRAISPNATTFSTSATINFTWATDRRDPSAPSTLHFYIGTSANTADNLIHEHYTCPASSSLSCPTTNAYLNFAPGTYYWGVAHSFANGTSYASDIYFFTVGSGPPPPPPPPPSPPPPPPGGDRDGDGVRDGADACPTQPGGPYDFNRNGCPGPFARITPTLDYTVVTSQGIANVRWMAISKLPRGATVTVRARDVVQAKLSVGRSGSVGTTRMGRVDFRGGDTFTLTISRPGSIGYYALIQVSTTRKPFPIRVQCLPPTGAQRPARCSSISRGK
jgi:hypothetical protein